MTPEIIHCEQLSEEWFNVRRGIISASHFSEVLNKGQGRQLYMMRLIAERMTGLTEPSFSNSYMEDGINTESSAREYYEGYRKVKLEQVGFIKLGDIGCSPDSLVGNDGGLEIKCPKSSTHINYIIKNKLPTTYIPQVQGNMFVTGRKWWDFVSFDPRNTIRPFFCVRVERDEKYINTILKPAIDKFVEEMNDLIEKVKIPF